MHDPRTTARDAARARIDAPVAERAIGRVTERNGGRRGGA
jgi:hypothetical protein